MQELSQKFCLYKDSHAHFGLTKLTGINVVPYGDCSLYCIIPQMFPKFLFYPIKLHVNFINLSPVLQKKTPTKTNDAMSVFNNKHRNLFYCYL